MIEERKKVEALKGKQVIVDQIKSREIDRLKAIEEQEKETQLMVQRMKEMEKEEARKVERKKEEQKKVNDEIVKSNKAASLVI